MSDEEFIRETLRLAKKGRGKVSPNPMVGAIIVKGNNVVATGYHKYFGGEHAEIVALNSIPPRVARNSVLYVNLEPCSHFGKQPPCTRRILEAGVQKVVAGTKDPHRQVNGRGIRALKRHGVDVRVGVLEEQCRALNEVFFTYAKTGRPFTTVKIAQTLDGRIAGSNGRSKWITSEPARKRVHKVRAEHDAVLVGIGTVLADNPNLTVRLVTGRNPRRIVVDRQLRIPLHSRVLTAGAERTVVVTTTNAADRRVREIEATGAAVWKVRANADGRVSLPALWRKIGREEISSVLVEGGSRIFSEVLKRRLGDRILVFVAPKILGGGLNAIDRLGIRSLKGCVAVDQIQSRRIGSDVLVSGRLLSRYQN